MLLKYYKERVATFMTNKTNVFWTNSDISYRVNDKDIIQYWGNSTDFNRILDLHNNHFINSNYHKYYMDCGLGNLWGGKSWCGLFITWADIYKYEPD